MKWILFIPYITFILITLIISFAVLYFWHLRYKEANAGIGVVADLLGRSFDFLFGDMSPVIKNK